MSAPTPASMPRRLPDGVARLPEDIEVPLPPRIDLAEKVERDEAREKRRVERRTAMRRAIGGDPARDYAISKVAAARRSADKAKGIRHDARPR